MSDAIKRAEALRDDLRFAERNGIRSVELFAADAWADALDALLQEREQAEALLRRARDVLRVDNGALDYWPTVERIDAFLADRSEGRVAIRCVCGNPNSPGIVHRNNGPCYFA